MTLTGRLVFLVLPLAAPGWLQGEVRMREGLWENTVTSSGHTATRKTCITRAQQESANGSVASLRESTEKALAKSKSCTLKEFTIVGNTQTVVMACGGTSMKHVTVFSADSFETTATSTEAGVTKTSLLKGRRLGDCPAGNPE